MTEFVGFLTLVDGSGTSGRRMCTIKNKRLNVYPLGEGGNPEFAIDINRDTVTKEVNQEEFIFSVSNGNVEYFFNAGNSRLFGTWMSVLKSSIESDNPISITDFDNIRFLGSGAHGEVNLVKNRRTGGLYAMKSVGKSGSPYTGHHKLPVESRVLGSVKSPFIVQLFYSFEDSGKYYTCMEYVDGTDMFSVISKGSLTIDDIRCYLLELATALHDMHKQGIIYRDLKPENILLDKCGHIKLIDFGSARKLDGESSTFCGTPEYMAPEVVTGKSYSLEIDWWALGILTYEMFYNRTPFFSKNQKRMMDKILNDDPVFSDSIDMGLRRLIEGLLDKDPVTRFGYDDVVKSSFLEGYSLERIRARGSRLRFAPKLTHSFSVDNFESYVGPLHAQENAGARRASDATVQLFRQSCDGICSMEAGDSPLIGENIYA